MKCLMSLLMCASLYSMPSYGFFTKLDCRGVSSKGWYFSNLPMYIDYIGDGIIEVTVNQKSCELDYTDPTPVEADRGWVRFKNNNVEIDNRRFNTHCSSVVNAFVRPANGDLTDLAWLTLSDEIINENKRQQELEKDRPQFLGQLGFFKAEVGAVAKKMLNCKFVN